MRQAMVVSSLSGHRRLQGPLRPFETILILLLTLPLAVVPNGCATGPAAEKRAEAQRLMKAAEDAGRAKDDQAARGQLEQAQVLFRETGDKEN